MNESQQVDVLVFSAHPDDTELSAGGMVAKLVSEGRKVGLIDLTTGELSTRGDSVTRKAESDAAWKILGASFRTQLDFQDGNLQTGRAQELEVMELIRRHKPSLLIAPWPDERHPDHARCGRLITDAWFYSGLKKVATASPSHRAQAVIYYLQNYELPPTFITDVSAVWETKMKSIYAYASQFYNPASKEPPTKLSQKVFIDAIEARGRFYGAQIGVEFGEAFISKQPPRVDDPIAAYRDRELS